MSIIYIVLFISATIIFILNIIIGKKRMNSTFLEDDFCQISEEVLPSTLKKILSTENIKILYYYSNDVNSHLIQRSYCNYIIFSSAALQQLNFTEICSLFFHEVGHFKSKHFEKIRIYYNIRNIICFAYIGIIIHLNFELNLSILQACTNSVFMFYVFLFCSRLLICRIQRNQEYEADKFAVSQMKGEYLINALNKTKKNIASNILSSYPDISHRIAKISQYA